MVVQGGEENEAPGSDYRCHSGKRNRCILRYAVISLSTPASDRWGDSGTAPNSHEMMPVYK